MNRTRTAFMAGAGLLFSIAGPVPAQNGLSEEAILTSEGRPAGDNKEEMSAWDVISDSIFLDVYSEPSEWQELSIGDFFSTGWDKPWVSPPTGGGGAPRHGWLNGFEGVFYRLSLGIFSWQHGPGNSNDSYTGTFESFTPFNQRFNLRTDIPIASSNGETNFGDFRMQGRFMLSETRDVTQTFNVDIRMPTGDPVNGNGVAAVSPQYQFWANWWKGLVVRGGTGFHLPFAGDIGKAGARATFDANLAVGYYFTPHDMTPIGDMVWYVASNVTQPIDNRADSSPTFVSLSPGFRTHMGMDWYLLGTVEVPVARPRPYDYKVLFAIMKVY